MTEVIESVNEHWDVFVPPIVDRSTTEYEYTEYREKNVNVTGLPQYELVNQDLDLFLLPSEAFIQVKCIIQNAAGGNIIAGDIALANSGYSLFDKAYYYLNDQLVESLDYVGMMTHIKHICNASKESEHTLQQQGFCLDRGYGGATNDITGNCLNGNGPGVRAVITNIFAQAAGTINITAAGSANADVIRLFINGNPIRIEGIERDTGVATIRDFILTANPSLSIRNGTANTHFRFYDTVLNKELAFLVNGHPLTFTSPAAAAAIVPVTLDGYAIVDGDKVTVCYKEEVSYYNSNINGKPISNSGFHKRKNSQFYSSDLVTGYNKKLTLMLPLWKLFPIFEHNRHVFRGVKHTIRLYKYQTVGDVILRSSNTQEVGNVIIDYISLWMPVLKPTIAVGLELDKQLSGGAHKVLAWKGNQLFRSNVFTVDNVNSSYRITSTAHRPTKIIAFFQLSSRLSNQTTNNRLFDSLLTNAVTSGVIRAHIRIGGTQYPRDEYQTTFTTRANSANEDLGRVYMAYLTTNGFEKDQDKAAPISYEEWRDLYPCWVFDLSAQDEQIWLNITSLDIEFRWQLSSNAPEPYVVWTYVEYDREIVLSGVNSRMAIKL